jgi:hypothetical protein
VPWEAAGGWKSEAGEEAGGWNQDAGQHAVPEAAQGTGRLYAQAGGSMRDAGQRAGGGGPQPRDDAAAFPEHPGIRARPGPRDPDLGTEIVIPAHAVIAPEWQGRVVLHNDPDIDATKAWSWDSVRTLARAVGPGNLLLIGRPGPEVDGALDLRGRTSLAQAAAVIRDCRAYVGIDSGLMWIAGSLRVPTVGIYGTAYIPNPAAIQPHNPRARYLECDGPAAGVPVEAVLGVLASG